MWDPGFAKRGLTFWETDLCGSRSALGNAVMIVVLPVLSKCIKREPLMMQKPHLFYPPAGVSVNCPRSPAAKARKFNKIQRQGNISSPLLLLVYMVNQDTALCPIPAARLPARTVRPEEASAYLPCFFPGVHAEFPGNFHGRLAEPLPVPNPVAYDGSRHNQYPQ